MAGWERIVMRIRLDTTIAIQKCLRQCPVISIETLEMESSRTSAKALEFPPSRARLGAQSRQISITMDIQTCLYPMTPCQISYGPTAGARPLSKLAWKQVWRTALTDCLAPAWE